MVVYAVAVSLNSLRLWTMLIYLKRTLLLKLFTESLLTQEY